MRAAIIALPFELRDAPFETLMGTPMTKRSPLLLVLLTFSATALADDDALRRCRAIPEATARLACYDAIPMPAPGAASAPRAPSGQAQAGATAPAPGAVTIGPDEFGFEEKVLTLRSASMSSTIPGQFLGWDPYTKIRLANGQVWQIIDDSRRAYSMMEPKVTIRRGVFGAFFLEIEGANTTPKVRRVE